MFVLGSKIMPVNAMRGQVKLGNNGGADPPTKTSTALSGSLSGDASKAVPTLVEPIADKTYTSEVEGMAQTKKSPKKGVIPARSEKKNSRDKPARRAIFSQYRRNYDKASTDDSYTTERHPSEILEFSPPVHHRHELQKRFKLLDNFPLEKTNDLPPLPTPLLRYTNDASATTGGVYPMVEPVSILRKGKYSKQNESSLSSIDATDDHPDVTAIRESASIDVCTPNTTDPSSTDVYNGNLSDFENIARKMSLEESKRFFRETEQGALDRERLVKFDPRIVITEFPDDERDWFTEEDLNRFMHEALMLAKHYMMLHPECAEEFSSPKIDPLTGKVQKKALFALPGLCSSDGLDTFGSSAEIERLLKNAVRKVLIVDPNKSILHLFEKCVQQMFPTANIISTQSGEEALQLYATELERQKNPWDGHNRGFDVVIVEERLCHRTGNSSGTQGIHHSARMVRMHSDSSSSSNSTTELRSLGNEEKGLSKQDSLFNLRDVQACSTNGTTREFAVSGSQLIQDICALENKFYNHSQSHEEFASSEALTSEVSSVLSPPQRWSLLIGVSINVERDGQKLKDSGADIVWGKPPPTVGDSLRNKIISALIAKRQQASYCVKIPTDEDDE